MVGQVIFAGRAPSFPGSGGVVSLLSRQDNLRADRAIRGGETAETQWSSMAYHEGDEITPGYEVQQAIPAGPLSERYVIRDIQGVSSRRDASPALRPRGRLPCLFLQWKSPSTAAILPATTVAVPLGRRDPMRWIDCSVPVHAERPGWPGDEPFRYEETETIQGGAEANCARMSLSVHFGTHVDAPIHFYEQGKTIDQVPLGEWFGPAVKIDVTAQCDANRDFRLGVSHIERFERKHGKIPDRAWVVMYTGIGTRHYPDAVKLLGTAKQGPEAVAELHFPGFSLEAAEFLLRERRITGIAIDTPSIDYGQSSDFPVHRAMFEAGKLAIEKIARLDRLPATGAVLFPVPMLIAKGTGAPARIFALLPE